MSSMHDLKGSFEDFPKEKVKADKQSLQVNMDSFSLPVTSVEGYIYAVVIVDEYY